MLHLPAIPIPVPTIEDTTRGINYLGLPAISVPAGLDAKDLPVAFQLVGRPFSKSLLLRAADAYQRVTDWHRRSPELR